MQPHDRSRPALDDASFRAALDALVAASGRSMRSLSLAMGRDAGYVAALLDPSRPSRARPTPQDLLALSDATGIPLVTLLETLWAIPTRRLAAELTRLDPSATTSSAALSTTDQRLVAEFAEFLSERRRRGRSSGDR